MPCIQIRTFDDAELSSNAEALNRFVSQFMLAENRQSGPSCADSTDSPQATGRLVPGGIAHTFVRHPLFRYRKCATER